MSVDEIEAPGGVSFMPRKPGMATTSAIRSIAPVAKNTPRQPTKIADDAGARRAQQIAGHGREQQLADRDLALRHRHAVADDRQRDREHAAGGMPASTRKAISISKFVAKPQASVAMPSDEHADRDQPRLAEHVGERAEHRLHQRIRQREGGRQQRRRRRRDVQSLRRSAE